MSTTYHTKVHTHTIKNEMSNRTMAFTIPEGLTKADVEGRLVEPDAAVPCGVKLLTDGAKLGRRVGRIDVWEPRGPGRAGVVTVQWQYTELVPILDGDALAQGDTPVGAGNGLVKKGTADPTSPFVTEVITIGTKKFASIICL